MSRKGRLQVSVFLNRVPLRYYCSNEAVGASRRTSERARRGRCRRAGRRFYRHREFPPRFIIRGTFAHVFSVEILIFIFSMTALHVTVARRASLGNQPRQFESEMTVPLQALSAQSIPRVVRDPAPVTKDTADMTAAASSRCAS